MPNSDLLMPVQTAAIATQVPYDSSGLDSLFVVAMGLVGADTVSVFTQDEASLAWFPVFAAGFPLVLSATESSVVLEGGPVYGFTKTLTGATIRLQGHPRRV